MSQEKWSEVAAYIDGLHPPDKALTSAVAASQAAGLPSISISHSEGRLLHLWAKSVNARHILEIGTLGGYSAIWLARALPKEGKLITLELDPKHAEVARKNLAFAGLTDRAEVRVGPALQSLSKMASEFKSGFDLIFIDADKTGYPEYWRQSLKLSHPGTLIIADNVVRNGAVSDSKSTDADVRAVREYLAMVAAEPCVHATVMQTVGPKGYDGMSVALVLREP